MSIFNDKQEKDIIDKYQSNIDIDLIIKEYNTEEHFIREVLKDKQIDRKYNTFTEELNQRLIFLYDKKKFTQKKICYDLLVSEMGIKNILKRNHIPKRSLSECNKKYRRNSNYFDHIDSENKAYFLGLLFADGNNFSPHNAITLALQEEDGYLVNKFAKEIEYSGIIHKDNLHDINVNYKNQIRIVVNDQHMSKRLYDLGMIDNKSLVLQFPTFLQEQYVRHFIRGYFDGDGGVYYDEKRHRLTTNTAGTLDMVTNIQRVLKNIGCSSYIYHPKQSSDHNTYVLHTCGNNNSLKYLSWLYESCDTKMIRKYNTYLNGKQKYGTSENLIRLTTE